jgi:hypothetical protein
MKISRNSLNIIMDYEKLSELLLNNFFLTDWERTWLEARFELAEQDLNQFFSILRKYHINLDEVTEVC